MNINELVQYLEQQLEYLNPQLNRIIQPNTISRNQRLAIRLTENINEGILISPAGRKFRESSIKQNAMDRLIHALKLCICKYIMQNRLIEEISCYNLHNNAKKTADEIIYAMTKHGCFLSDTICKCYIPAEDSNVIPEIYNKLLRYSENYYDSWFNKNVSRSTFEVLKPSENIDFAFDRIVVVQNCQLFGNLHVSDYATHLAIGNKTTQYLLEYGLAWGDNCFSIQYKINSKTLKDADKLKKRVSVIGLLNEKDERIEDVEYIDIDLGGYKIIF